MSSISFFNRLRIWWRPSGTRLEDGVTGLSGLRWQSVMKRTIGVELSARKMPACGNQEIGLQLMYGGGESQLLDRAIKTGHYPDVCVLQCVELCAVKTRATNQAQ